MATRKLSESLANHPAGPLDGTEAFHVLQDGETKGATVGQLDAIRQWHTLKQPAIASGALAIDLVSPAGFHVVLTEDVTTLTFPNASASRFIEFTVVLEQDGTGGRSVTFPASVQNPPTIAAAAGAFTVATFATWDGATTIHTLFTI